MVSGVNPEKRIAAAERTMSQNSLEKGKASTDKWRGAASAHGNRGCINTEQVPKPSKLSKRQRGPRSQLKRQVKQRGGRGCGPPERKPPIFQKGKLCRKKKNEGGAQGGGPEVTSVKKKNN